MKPSFKSFCTLLVVLLFNTSVYSYTIKIKEDQNKPTLKLDLTRALLDEAKLRFNLPRSSSESIEIMGGFIYPGYLKTIWESFSSTRFYYYGFSTGVYYKKYSAEDDRKYWTLGLEYRYKFYDNEELWNTSYLFGPAESDEFRMELSQDLHVLHIKAQKGKEYRVNTLIWDIYYGVGLKGIYATTSLDDLEMIDNGLTFNSLEEIPKEITPFHGNGFYLIPTFHLGVRLGVKLKQ